MSAPRACRMPGAATPLADTEGRNEQSISSSGAWPCTPVNSRSKEASKTASLRHISV
jgi:hypothetical protein